jgi:hypothetical protein
MTNATETLRAALANTATLRARPARFGDFSGRREGWAVRCGQIVARYATRAEADAAAEIAAATYAAWLRDEATALGVDADAVEMGETFAVEPCEAFAH